MVAMLRHRLGLAAAEDLEEEGPPGARRDELAVRLAREEAGLATGLLGLVEQMADVPGLGLLAQAGHATGADPALGVATMRALADHGGLIGREGAYFNPVYIYLITLQFKCQAVN